MLVVVRVRLGTGHLLMCGCGGGETEKNTHTVPALLTDGASTAFGGDDCKTLGRD